MLGIIKNNKHSYRDFGLTIKSKSIGIPSKRKIKHSVPFMNGTYDFSNLYGSQSYDERQLSYVFNIIGYDKYHMNVIKTQVINWLMNSFSDRLYDDSHPGYYFIAECEDVDFVEDGFIGELSITFMAYPFKISSEYEGNNLWDDFNFELDCLQDSSFAINGSNTVNLYNRSATNITPTIHCSSNMEIVKDGVTYKLNAGTSKDYRLELSMGNNEMTIKGNGNIEFKFRAEVL